MSLSINYTDNIPQLVDSWRSDSKPEAFDLYIGVDIGGTNTRVALGCDETFEIIATFKSDSTRLVVDGLTEVAQMLREQIDTSSIKAACLDAAGRVTKQGTEVEITNYRSGQEHQMLSLSELPSDLFPQDHSRIINDLESACYGIAGLNGRQSINEYFKILLGPKDEEETPRLQYEHYLVVAVGTGMGVGLLMALPEEDDFVVLPLEGGHILLSSASLNSDQRREEEEMLTYISCAIYGGDHSLEYEDLVSGRGLEALYKFFAQSMGDETTDLSLSAEQVSSQGLNGNVIAERALLYHYLFLARGTANLAVCMGAKGVFWAGDNQISNMQFVDGNAAALHKEFMNHPKAEWLKPLPIYAQKKKFNVNLEGTITVSRNLAKREPNILRERFEGCLNSTAAEIVEKVCGAEAPVDAHWSTSQVLGVAVGSACCAAGLAFLMSGHSTSS